MRVISRADVHLLCRQKQYWFMTSKRCGVGLVAGPRNPGQMAAAMWPKWPAAEGFGQRPWPSWPSMLRPTAMAGLAVMAVEAYIGLRQSCLPYLRCLRSKFSQIRLNIYGFGDGRLWPAV